MVSSTAPIEPIAWRDDALRLLDQRRLPAAEIYLQCTGVADVVDAIRDMIVRGAPAIGIAAAYGVVLAAREAYRRSGADWSAAIAEDMMALRDARPTAVNLAWALDRMQGRFAGIEGDPFGPLLLEARAMHREDVAANRRMGNLGAALLERDSRVITHCNAGALATAGYGTALGVIRSANASGRIELVYATETRPWLQGARLTAWELVKEAIPACLIADSAAAYVMRSQRIDWVITGADRIAANGDVANKIGTYALAVAARAHGVRFMVVAPLSTIDRNTACGDDIPIETRSAEELLCFNGSRLAAQGITALNPVFDVTPAELIDVIVTESGVLHHPNLAAIAGLF